MKDFKAIEEQVAVTDNQYMLALAIAKRIKHLRSGAPTLSSVDNPGEFPVKAALVEFAQNLITYSQTEAGDSNSEKDNREDNR
jgi:DNA-directed RNA polymerase subunit K/omega